MKRIILLGSTGSIGTQTLEIIRAHPEEFQIIGLSAHGNTQLFEKQVREFQPKYVLLTSMSENPTQALMSLAQTPEADLIVNALSGSAGCMPMYASLQVGKTVALANKESLVMAGEFFMQIIKETGAKILPIDSEPSAIWQILETRARGYNGNRDDIEKIILTASGGPFWKWKKEELERVSTREALKHPTWKMGEKVSIDSATLMNKAFEIIEARWLFTLPVAKIDVVIHRQSLVHSFVQFIDGNISALLSSADMRIPISYALFYPERRMNLLSRLDFSQLQLTFEKPDYSIFEGPKLAYEIIREGGIMPAVFCLADEVAVEKFLRGEISFLGIYDFIKRAMERIKNIPFSLQALKELPQRLSL